jgi:tRNA threonylcarbamoyladenosine biosynthesis protein TsaB
MKILAIDFSTALRGVALADAAGGSVRVLGRAGEQHGRTTHAFAMIDDVLKQAGLVRAAIDRLAIGLGPGSYAGIRVSLAIAQGWQLATGVQTLGVSSVDSLAEAAWVQGVRGATSFIVDAQRGEYYLADYQLDEAGCQETKPLDIVARIEVEQRLAAGIGVFGPEATMAFPGATDLFPDPGVLAQFAARRTDFVSAPELQPIYLRAVNFVKAPQPVRSF